MEYVRSRMRVEFIKKDDIEKITKQQSKLPFSGIHKSYEKYDSYSIKKRSSYA